MSRMSRPQNNVWTGCVAVFVALAFVAVLTCAGIGMLR